MVESTKGNEGGKEHKSTQEETPHGQEGKRFLHVKLNRQIGVTVFPKSSLFF